MRFAITVAATGEIIKQGKPLEDLLNHLKVNPCHYLVKKSKNKWVLVDMEKFIKYE